MTYYHSSDQEHGHLEYYVSFVWRIGMPWLSFSLVLGTTTVPYPWNCQLFFHVNITKIPYSSNQPYYYYHPKDFLTQQFWEHLKSKKGWKSETTAHLKTWSSCLEEWISPSRSEILNRSASKNQSPGCRKKEWKGFPRWSRIQFANSERFELWRFRTQQRQWQSVIETAQIP